MTQVANDVTVELSFNKEELQALSDVLHKKTDIRFNPDKAWTAVKMLQLRTRIDAELALLKAEKPLP